MKIRIILATLWLLSLALVALMTRDATVTSQQELAKQSASNTTALVKSNDPAASTSAPAPRVIEKMVLVERDASERQQLTPFGSSDEGATAAFSMMSVADLQRSLPGALADEGDTMQNNLIVAQMLANLDESNVAATLRTFEQAPRNPLNDHNFRMFMYAWGEIDGQAAVEYAFNQEDGKKVHYGGSVAMIGWASQDPASAQAYVDAVSEDHRSRGYMVDVLVRGWAKTDIGGASNYVSEMPEGGGRKKLVSHLAEEHIKYEGAQGALAWADRVVASSDDPAFAANVFSDAGFFAAREDAMTTAKWLEQNLDSEYLNPRVFEEVADEMAEIDAFAAAEFLDRHFEDERVNGKVIAETVEEWARKDPTAAADWVNEYLGHEKINNEVVHELAGEWARTDPEAALDWVAGLDNAGLQKRGLTSAVERWSRENPAEVGAWLNSQTQRGDLYDPAIEAYANRIAHQTPIAALSWAQQIQNEGLRERTTVRAGQAMARQDKDAVISWLPTSGLSERAQNAILNPPKNDHHNRWRR